VLQRFDGYIAQHLGDALLVYFGFPQAHEDDAQRAILAGLGILHAMQSLNARLTQGSGGISSYAGLAQRLPIVRQKLSARLMIEGGTDIGRTGVELIKNGLRLPGGQTSKACTQENTPQAFPHRPSRGPRTGKPLRPQPHASSAACPDRALPRYAVLRAAGRAG
jgi:hypothetical protein